MFFFSCCGAHQLLHSFPTRRSSDLEQRQGVVDPLAGGLLGVEKERGGLPPGQVAAGVGRSEEHTSELQSRPHLVCRLLLEKKNCRVIDNYGDISVCWRLARQLANEYPVRVSLCFFFHAAAPTNFYTLSLHDALPISSSARVS